MTNIQIVPITKWSSTKSQTSTDVEIQPSQNNGLSKKSIADCLQTRPVDHQHRLIKIRGEISPSKVEEIDQSLRIVFELN